MSTLDQQRAQFAWEAVTTAREKLKPSDDGKKKPFEDYKNLAKGAPALIMGNGLMAALAFYESRKKKDITVPHAAQLRDNVLAWLVIRFKDVPAFQPLPTDFRAAMEKLQSADSSLYMQATDETLAMLRWLRQFADAVSAGGA